ncbi:MAG TPA: hypothetical protein VMU16_14200 [Candidatus Binataceae bacterium]|nr:hypothetical protein [Candidatus Binataceae bacterium]
MKKLLPAIGAAALAAAILFSSNPACAQSNYLERARAQRDLTPALQESLEEMLGDVAGPYLDEQDEKKASGQKYVDLQQKFEYLPNYGPNHQLVVSCKLGGAEYNPKQPGSSKGAATGNLKYLVFTYALQNGKWVQYSKPKWEEQQLGEAAAQKMTQHVAHADKAKAAMKTAGQISPTSTKSVAHKHKRTHPSAAADAAAGAQKAADKAQ